MTVYLSPFAGAGAQFFTDDGSVLSGGKIYTYAAGTTTPLTTYTSISGTTANPNPIILDSGGRLPEDMWLTEGLKYRFVLTDSCDIQLGEYDDIAGVNDISTGTVPWSIITGKPTTVAGYGITNALTTTVAAATYAPLASPTFTGTPLIPDNDTVSANFAVGYREAPQVSKTDNYTLVLADRGKSILMNGQIKRIQVAVFVIANNRLTKEPSVAVTTVTLEVAVTEPSTLVPSARSRVKHPRRVSVRKVQHIERVTVLLVRVRHGIGKVAVALNRKLNGVRRYTHRLITLRSIHNALTPSVCAEPKDGVIHLGYRVRRNTADLVISALDAGERKIGVPGVVPDLHGIRAK